MPQRIRGRALATFWLFAGIGWTSWAFVAGGAASQFSVAVRSLLSPNYPGREIFVSPPPADMFAFTGGMLLVIGLPAAFLEFVGSRGSFALEGKHAWIMRLPRWEFATAFTLVILIEELTFRLLPLGAIAAFLPRNPASTVGVVLGASLLCALAHYSNQERKGRNCFLLVLPFLSGIFFSSAFLLWGFLGAAIVHLAFSFFLLFAIKELDAEDVSFGWFWQALSSRLPSGRA